MISESLAADALRYAAAGLSVMPVGPDKRPLGGWAHNQKIATPPEQLSRQLKAAGASGVAVVTGRVSGGMFCVDFDADKERQAHNEVDPAANLSVFLEAISRYVDTSTLPIVQTQSGGFHAYFRYEKPDGNTKLAAVPANNRQGKVFIAETRGQGGYSVLPGSRHANGGVYTLLQGDLTTAPLLNEEQYQALHRAARALDKMPPPKVDEPSLTRAYRQQQHKQGGGVIEAFNAKYLPTDILERNGYVQIQGKWRSPDSTSGNAGVVVFKDAPLIFSHHGDVLGDGKAHDAFDVYTILEHGGQVKAAVKEAAAELGMTQKPVATGAATDAAPRTSVEIITNRQVKAVTADVAERLKAMKLEGQPRIYSRGDGLLVEMREGYELREVTKPDSLKALLHDHLEPVIEKKGPQGEYTTPSVFSNNHTALLTRKTNEFPPIKTVSDIPLMLPDGSILQTPGYHERHGYYLNTAGIETEFVTLEAARHLFLETFNEFSYQAPKAGFTATLAFILQPFLMPVIDDLTPMFGIFGSRRAGSGTGKGYMLDCVYRIHRGRPYTHDGSMPASDEEMGKVLFSALSEGVSHIIFDDIDHLKHRQLMAAITSRTYKGRILGVSQRHEVSTSVTWAVSGNAPEIHRDFYRRLIPIYMGVGKARAWERPYSRPDLNRYILENRNRYISASLSILENWRLKGMPLSTKVIRGFDRWSAVMGGVLEAAGFPDLLKARDGLDELIEVDNSDLDLLIKAWQESSLADKKLRGKDLLNLARDRELLTELHDGRSDASGAAELGKFLKPFINDVFKDHYLRREFDSDLKTWHYFLEAVVEKPRLLSEVFNFSALETTAIHPRNTPVTSSTGVLRGFGDDVSRANTYGRDEY